MSWGTYYKYDGYLNRIGKEELGSRREECDRLIDSLFGELLAYMAATPPAYAENAEGEKYPYAEFLSMKLREIREALEEEISLRARLADCLDTLERHPENVTEG